MILQDFINQVLDTHVPVGSGQCGELVDLYLIDCFGNHTAYNDAKDYWFNGIPGFVAVTDPQAGDIAVYNAHGTYTEGHIAIYVGNGEVFEQNADPDGSSPHTFPRATTYLLGYLRSEGENMNPNAGDVINAYQLINGRPATPEEQAAYTAKSWSAPDGLFYGKILIDIQNLQKAQSATFSPAPQLFVKD